MENILFIIGFLIIFVGSIILLIEMFRESIIWGIGAIIVGPVSLVFVFLHWDVSKRPVLMQLAGFVVVFFGALIAGKI